jgi:hypothetical protein
MSTVRWIVLAAVAALGGTVGLPGALAADLPGVAIRAGRDALIAEDPRAALAHYREALALLGPDDREARFAALLGIARSAAWLEDYKLAERSYRAALPLAASEEDRAAASAGLAQMLTIADRPRAAYAFAAPFANKSSANAVEAARAALAMGREDKAATALSVQNEAMAAAEPNSRLGRDYNNQRDELTFRLRPHVLGVFEYTKDSDGVRTYDTGIGAAFSGKPLAAGGPAARWDVAAHHVTIDDGSTRAAISQFQGGVHTRLADDWVGSAWLGAARHDDWTYAVGGAQLSFRTRDEWGVEVSADRDAVRTIAALASRITVGSVTLGGDVRIADAVLAGALGQQKFGDGNERDYAVVRVTLPTIMTPPGWPSLTPQLYARYFKDSDPGPHGYFNPRRFEEQRINLFVAARLSRAWVMRLTLGPGRQSVDGESSNTLTGELKLTGRVAQSARVEILAAYGDTAAYASSGPGYRRTSVQGNLVIPW